MEFLFGHVRDTLRSALLNKISLKSLAVFTSGDESLKASLPFGTLCRVGIDGFGLLVDRIETRTLLALRLRRFSFIRVRNDISFLYAITGAMNDLVSFSQFAGNLGNRMYKFNGSHNII